MSKKRRAFIQKEKNERERAREKERKKKTGLVVSSFLSTLSTPLSTCLLLPPFLKKTMKRQRAPWQLSRSTSSLLLALHGRRGLASFLQAIQFIQSRLKIQRKRKHHYETLSWRDFWTAISLALIYQRV